MILTIDKNCFMDGIDPVYVNLWSLIGELLSHTLHGGWGGEIQDEGDDIGALERQKKNRNQFQGRILLFDPMIGFRSNHCILVSTFRITEYILLKYDFEIKVKWMWKS